MPSAAAASISPAPQIKLMSSVQSLLYFGFCFQLTSFSGGVPVYLGLLHSPGFHDCHIFEALALSSLKLVYLEEFFLS